MVATCVMHCDERCQRAVCGKTARTVRKGAAGNLEHGETEHAPRGKPKGLSPSTSRPSHASGLPHWGSMITMDHAS
jgi:hypothetical protein